MSEYLYNPNDYHVIRVFRLRSDHIVEEQIIPLYDIEAVAGLVELFVDGHIPLNEIRIPNMPPCDGAIYVKGDSMEPLLHQGDIVLYKTTNSRRGGLFFGEMYLLEFYLDGEQYITVKYVYESERAGYYRLESENPNHRPREIPRDCVKAMALIKLSIRFN